MHTVLLFDTWSGHPQHTVKFGEYRPDLALVLWFVVLVLLNCNPKVLKLGGFLVKVSQMLIFDSSITSVVKMPSLEDHL